MLNQAWENFMIAAQGGEPESVPVALHVDCGFIASAFGMDALDFYMYPDQWLHAYVTLMARFPNVVFLPGFWVEFGTAAEPSAFGTPVMWRHDQAPAMRHLNLSEDDWGRLTQPDPYSDGLMALVLRRYWNLEHSGELPEPHRVHFVAARGPFAVATHVLGGSRFLAALDDEPDSSRAVMDAVEIFTETTIRFLRAQLACLREPLGIVVMDDIVGTLTAGAFARFAAPAMQRIFKTFDGLVRIFRCDTPCRPVLPQLPELGFEVFHFSHRLDIREVRDALGSRIALMGNVPPVEILARGVPEQVESAGHECVVRAGKSSGLILSAAGTVLSGTPSENIDALVRAARH
jgi:uroporphyrinogen decarboxylase